jgi:hypothetical protein
MFSTTPPRLGCDLKRMGAQLSGVEDAVEHGDVADAAGGLAAHGHAALAVGEVRVLDEDVLGGAVDAQAVGVLAGLDGDAVVVVVDVDVVDVDVFGGVDVDAVGAGDVVLGGDARSVRSRRSGCRGRRGTRPPGCAGSGR